MSQLTLVCVFSVFLLVCSSYLNVEASPYTAAPVAEVADGLRSIVQTAQSSSSDVSRGVLGLLSGLRNGKLVDAGVVSRLLQVLGIDASQVTGPLLTSIAKLLDVTEKDLKQILKQLV